MPRKQNFSNMHRMQLIRRILQMYKSYFFYHFIFEIQNNHVITEEWEIFLVYRNEKSTMQQTKKKSCA